MKAGRILRVGGGHWDDTMSDDEIDWIGNEGARVSRILADLAQGKWSTKEQGFVGELMAGGWSEAALPPSKPAPAPAPSVRPDRAPAAAPAASPATWIQVQSPSTFYVGCTLGEGVPRAEVRDAAVGTLEKKLRFDTDSSNRARYDPGFLGIEIPLPGVSQKRRKEMVKAVGGKILVLDYHHFSLAMNEKRRFQMWSAVNVDYSAAARAHARNRDAFGSDTWTLDPRLPASLQVQNDEFYGPATAVDRGHVVRRDDNCWGASLRETEFANSDTFHWTNCTPQHERFNRSRLAGIWGGLEDAIKQQSEEQAERMSIFAGPVLDAGDPDAYGIQYPVKFWKVVAAVVDGELSAYGFVLDQTPVVDEFGLEVLDFGKFTVHQRPLLEIERMTGVVLPDVLEAADVLLGNEAIDLGGGDELAHRARR
jgi:endonuclease G